MKRTQRLLLLGALLLAVAALLSYRSWRTHQIMSRLNRARVHLEQDEPELAMYILRPLLEAGRRDAELYYLVASCYRLMGDPAKSLEYVTIAAESGHEAYEVDQERGLALFGLGRLQEAEPLLRASPTKQSLAALAILHFELFEMDQSLNDLDAWSSLDPKNHVPHVIRGDVWVLAPNYEKAAGAFRRALELEPHDFEARLKLASALRELGELGEAIALARQCQKEQPNEPTAVLLLAQCESESGDAAAARVLLEGLVEVYPDLAAPIVELGKLELEDGNFDKAAQLLRRAVILEPQNDSALYNLATALRRIGRDDESAPHLARFDEIQKSRRRLRDLLDRVETDPTDIEAHAGAAAVCMDLGDPQQAGRHLTAVLARDPNHAAARETLQRLQTSMPDFADTPAPTMPRESRP